MSEKFNKLFPSLKQKTFWEDAESTKRIVYIDDIEQHCIDKDRFKEELLDAMKVHINDFGAQSALRQVAARFDMLIEVMEELNMELEEIKK